MNSRQKKPVPKMVPSSKPATAVKNPSSSASEAPAAQPRLVTDRSSADEALTLLKNLALSKMNEEQELLIAGQESRLTTAQFKQLAMHDLAQCEEQLDAIKAMVAAEVEMKKADIVAKQKYLAYSNAVKSAVTIVSAINDRREGELVQVKRGDISFLVRQEAPVTSAPPSQPALAVVKDEIVSPEIDDTPIVNTGNIKQEPKEYIAAALSPEYPVFQSEAAFRILQKGTGVRKNMPTVERPPASSSSIVRPHQFDFQTACSNQNIPPQSSQALSSGSSLNGSILSSESPARPLHYDHTGPRVNKRLDFDDLDDSFQINERLAKAANVEKTPSRSRADPPPMRPGRSLLDLDEKPVFTSDFAKALLAKK